MMNQNMMRQNQLKKLTFLIIMCTLYPKLVKKATSLLVQENVFSICGPTGCGKSHFIMGLLNANNFQPFVVDASVKKSIKSLEEDLKYVNSNHFGKRCVVFSEFDIFLEDLFPVSQLFDIIQKNKCKTIIEIHCNNQARLQRLVPSLSILDLNNTLPAKSTLLSVLKQYNTEENTKVKVKDIKEYIDTCYPDVSKMKCTMKAKLTTIEVYEDSSMAGVVDRIFQYSDVSKLLLHAQTNVFMIPPIIHENYIKSKTENKKKLADFLSLGDVVHTRMYADQQMDLMDPYLAISVASTVPHIRDVESPTQNSAYIAKFSNLSTKHSTIKRLCELLQCDTLCQLHMHYKLAKVLRHKKNVTMSLKRLCEVQI